ncbi:MAG: hypothetical protein IT452_00870 [Planctomycetia bacterium]|nr:hypothetical protein [Planctomycetia bacterium]
MRTAVVGAGICGSAIAHALPSPDARLQVGRCCAWLFSGHGFKVAPAVARRLAEAVVAGRRPEGLPAFALNRG